MPPEEAISHGPTFFIIGAAKAGTTSLASLLATHPHVGIARSKEPHFFSEDTRYYLGMKGYLSEFSHCEGRVARGDASTSYSRIRYYPRVVARIYNDFPEGKIIYMVRHPLERMESAYIEHLCTPGGRVASSINDAVRSIPMILDSSRYGEVYRAYSDAFGRSNVLVVWFDEYVKEQAEIFRAVCRFLGVSDSISPIWERENRRARVDAERRLVRIGRRGTQIDCQWNAETRKWALDQLRADNSWFLYATGRDISYWGDLYQ